MFEIIHLAFNAALLVALCASAAMWVIAIRFHWGAHPIEAIEWMVPARRRARPFWSPFDVFVMFGTMFLVGQLLMLLAVQQGWITRSPETGAPTTATSLLVAMWINTFAGMVAAIFVITWLRFFNANALKELGLSVHQSDVTLGFKASLILLPPVLLISAAATYIVPYEHPVLDSLKELFTPGVFIVTFIGTALFTPFIEELMIRVLLQGGLQGLIDRNVDSDNLWRPQSYLPILVSSSIFAALHIGQGAAPIPLFVLSLGLGFLYRQTGSITPSLVVHVVLNSLTLFAEMIRLQTT